MEEHFYLLFPLLYLGLRRLLPDRRHQFIVLMSLAGLVLAWRMLLVHGWQAIDLHHGSSHHPRTCHGTDTRFDGLLFVMLPLSLVVLLGSFVLREVAFRETWRYTVQGLALLPVFIAVIRHPDWLPFRFLNWPWVRHLGVVSYAFYLVHSLVLASLMDHCIEKPCARPKKRFAAR